MVEIQTNGKFTNHMVYDEYGHIESVNGILIGGDKHAYQCIKCGAIFMSKNLMTRNLYDTGDPKSLTCYKTCGGIENTEQMIRELPRICKCEPIV